MDAVPRTNRTTPESEAVCGGERGEPHQEEAGQLLGPREGRFEHIAEDDLGEGHRDQRHQDRADRHLERVADQAADNGGEALQCMYWPPLT